MENRAWPHWALAITYAIAAALVMILLYYDWGYDDPFITYRYARNLRHGLGLVYNPGEKVLSTTTPLFAFLLAMLSFLWSDLPHLAVVIGAICTALGGLLLWEWAYRYQKPLMGWFGLTIFPAFPLLLSTLGSETPLYLLLCLGSFYFYARGQYRSTAICLAFASLTRPDAVLVGLVLAVYHWVMLRRSTPWTAVFIYLGILLPWVMFSFFYFGSPLPATLAAKQAQANLEISEGFAPGLLTILNYGYGFRWQYQTLAVLGLIGILPLTRRPDPWLPLIGWNILYFVAYTILGVTRYFWYYAPLVMGLVLMAGLGIHELKDFVIARIPSIPHYGRILISCILLLPWLMAVAGDSVDQSQSPDNRLSIYRTAGEWIQSNTDHDAAVGALEVGIIGYYSERKMIDFAGLIQPAIAQQIAQSRTYKDALTWGIPAYHPPYLVLNPAWFGQSLDQTLFPFCSRMHILEGEIHQYPGNLAIYKCQWQQ